MPYPCRSPIEWGQSNRRLEEDKDKRKRTLKGINRNKSTIPTILQSGYLSVECVEQRSIVEIEIESKDCLH